MNQENNKHSEGNVTKKIEQQTAKLPSDIFLQASIGAMATSARLKIMGREKDALFLEQWAARFLLFGVYKKIVKVQGSDANDEAGENGKR